MNWLIQEYIFTYFYNKFRPVNRMHYIKCGVNSSLHNSGCCIRSVAPWITVLSRETEFTKRVNILQIYFCAIFRETRHHAQAHVTSGALCALSLATRRTWPHRWVGDLAGQCLLWWLLVLLLSVFFLLLKIVFPVARLHTWFRKSMSATRIHCWLLPELLFIFFQPVLDTHNCLPCLDYCVWHGTGAEM